MPGSDAELSGQQSVVDLYQHHDPRRIYKLMNKRVLGEPKLRQGPTDFFALQIQRNVGIPIRIQRLVEEVHPNSFNSQILIITKIQSPLGYAWDQLW